MKYNEKDLQQMGLVEFKLGGEIFYIKKEEQDLLERIIPKQTRKRLPAMKNWKTILKKDIVVIILNLINPLESFSYMEKHYDEIEDKSMVLSNCLSVDGKTVQISLIRRLMEDGIINQDAMMGYIIMTDSLDAEQKFVEEYVANSAKEHNITWVEALVAVSNRLQHKFKITVGEYLTMKFKESNEDEQMKFIQLLSLGVLLQADLDFYVKIITDHEEILEPAVISLLLLLIDKNDEFILSTGLYKDVQILTMETVDRLVSKSDKILTKLSGITFQGLLERGVVGEQMLKNIVLNTPDLLIAMRVIGEHMDLTDLLSYIDENPTRLGAVPLINGTVKDLKMIDRFIFTKVLSTNELNIVYDRESKLVLFKGKVTNVEKFMEHTEIQDALSLDTKSLDINNMNSDLLAISDVVKVIISENK